ncbi:MAG: extracellular solute-binding protein [Thermoanaerobaculum sp.]
MRSAWLAVALLAAACTGKDDPSLLTFWALGREGEAVAPILRDFEKANPGIRVRLQQIPFTAAHEKLLTAIVGRSTPDVAQVGNTWIPELAALKVLEPLDPWLPRFSGLNPQNFFPGIWETNVVDGVVWGIPWYVDTRVLFYRQDLLAAAGFPSPPKTWESFRQAMQALKQKGLCPFAIYLPTDEWAQLVILAMQQGAILVSPEAEPKFAEPSFTRALEYYLTLFHEGLAPVVGNAQVGNYYQRFADGWFAMYITGPWNLGEFRRLGLKPGAGQSYFQTAGMDSVQQPMEGFTLELKWNGGSYSADPSRAAVMGGEDFSQYYRADRENVESLIFWVGGVPQAEWERAQKGEIELPSLHSPFWAPDAPVVIATATEALTAATLDLMGKKGG